MSTFRTRVSLARMFADGMGYIGSDKVRAMYFYVNACYCKHH